MLSQGEFLGYEDKVDIKILRRVFCSQGSGVRDLGLGVRGQNLGHKLVKSRIKGQNESKF